MSRYFTRPRAFYVADDVWQDAPHRETPQVPEHVATDTGLLDAHGNTIWRGPNPIGFDFGETR